MRKTCQQSCGFVGSMMCNLSFLCRLLIIPAVWWGLIGLGGTPPGYRLFMERFGMSEQGAAAWIAVILAATTTVSLLPCCFNRRRNPTQKAVPPE